MSLQIAEIFEQKRAEFERTILNTMRGSRGRKFSDLAHFFYASAYRGASKLLEQRSVLPRRASHKNGVDWIFWADEQGTRQQDLLRTLTGAWAVPPLPSHAFRVW